MPPRMVAADLQGTVEVMRYVKVICKLRGKVAAGIQGTVRVKTTTAGGTCLIQDVGGKPSYFRGAVAEAFNQT